MLDSRDQFDQELDDALATYANAPESEGLERRVLARVTQRTVRRGPILQWAAVALATVAAGCWLFWSQPLNPPARKQLVDNAISAAHKIEASKTVTLPPRHLAIALANTRKPRRILKRLAEPKLPQFPTPFPMTAEERALLRLARGDQKLIAQGLTHLGGPVEPIQVTALEIKPLE